MESLIGKRCHWALTAPVRPENRSSTGKLVEVGGQLVFVEWTQHNGTVSSSWIPREWLILDEDVKPEPAIVAPEPDWVSKLGKFIADKFL